MTTWTSYPDMPGQISPEMALLWTEAGNELGRLDSEETALEAKDGAALEAKQTAEKGGQ
jgi:hypothetical protein